MGHHSGYINCSQSHNESLIFKTVPSDPGVEADPRLEAKTSGTTQRETIHPGINQLPGFQGTGVETAFMNLEYVQAE